MAMTTKEQNRKINPNWLWFILQYYSFSYCIMVYLTALSKKLYIETTWLEHWIYKEFFNLTHWPTNRDFSLDVVLNRETIELSGIWRLDVATVKFARDCMMPYHRHFRLFLQITFSISFALVHPWERLWVRVQKPFKKFFWILPWRDE